MMKRWARRRPAQRLHADAAPRIEPLENRRLLAADLTVFQASQSAGVEAAAEEALQRPSVNTTTPVNGATAVPLTAYISAYVNLPNVGGVTDDPATLAANVRLVRTGDVAGAPIPSRVNTTGGGDAVVLTPLNPLAPNTEYTFQITEGLTDTAGAPFQTFSMSFTTGDSDDVAPDPTVSFTKVSLPTAAGRRFTGITIGPDHRVYAGTMEGEILRFDILADGTLSAPFVISSVRNGNGGDRRIVTGLRFDPSSTASNLVMWVTHGDGAETNAPDWTGKVSQLTGPNLGTYQDYVVNLPRSVRDHLTQQMDFHPQSGLLYVSQGSNNSMGDPDNAWGLREERLLSAAVLQIDTAAIATRIAAGDGPLDVQTDETSDEYDPFAPGAPVTLYATGVRNAFDLIWHSNGSLYAPTNGSAPGGNTPAGDGAPAVRNVRQNQPDLLFKINPGKYYGHPNPLRDEFVLNGGNPTSGTDPLQVNAYPVGTDPDENWEQAVYNFGDNRSPNGVIEYKSDTFAGSLKGSLIVCEYSGGDDLVVLRPDVNGNVPAGNVRRGMTGTTGLVDPVDLIEDVGPGNIYVTEYGASRITLLRPNAVTPAAPRNVGRAVFNDPVGGPASPARTLQIKNPNAGPITLTAIEILGEDAAMFRITQAPATPLVVPAFGKVEISVVFDPPAGAELGISTAGLRVTPSDITLPPLELSLRGLATAGETGVNEPSLQRVLDLNEIPVDVGDNDPATAELPLPLADSNEAIEVEGLVKAGSGPVRLEIVSVFANSSSPTIRFGYYNPANNQQTEVLTVNESQRTRPAIASGSVTFDPGTGTFGLYSTAPAIGTTAFTEDYRNTFEPIEANRRKALFFPLREPDGDAVADAFVVAFEEVASGYDYQDFVVIVRNVRAVDVPPPAPELTVEFDGAELSSGGAIDFGSVQEGDSGPERTLTVRNDGNIELAVGAVTLPSGFELVQGLSFTSLPAGASDTLRVRLSTSAPGTFDGQATFVSSDADEGNYSLRLTGTVTALPVTPPPPPPPPGPGDPPQPPPQQPGQPPVLTAGVSGGLPSVVVAGTKTARGRVSVIVNNNQFTSFAGPVTISVVAAPTGVSASATGDETVMTPLVTTTKMLKLKPHAQKVVKLKLAVPANVPEGDKALRVSVSTSDGRSDTIAGQAFRVVPPVVQLVGSPATVPAGLLTFGKPARLRVPLRNDGNVQTTRTPATYQLLVSTSATDATTPLFSTTASSKLAIKPGATKSVPLTVTIPAGVITPGNYFLHLQVQADLNATNGDSVVVMPFSIS